MSFFSVNVFSVFVALLIIVFTWMKWCHSYWNRRGLITPPVSVFYGTVKGIFTQKESFRDHFINLYKFFKSQNKIHGGLYFLHSPNYVPMDPELIKIIMLKDFEYFVDRGVFLNEQGDPLSAHLFSLEGTKWKNLRTKFTPTFTSGKMKMMFDVLVTCGDQLKAEMDKNIAESVDIKDILGRFTTDIIGNCAFGIDCNSLKNPDNEFTKHLQLFFLDGFWDNVIGFFTFIAPNLSNKLGVTATKPALAKFIMKVVGDTVDYREKNNIYRKDFMHLLLQLKNRGRLVDDGKIFDHEDNKQIGDVSLSFNELAAQAFIFFLAGFETSSTTMTFCLFELSSNPDVQEKLRREINETLTKHNNQLTYEAIQDMHYMDNVINETLRKYPPLPVLNRVCTKDYKVPGTDLLLEKGTKVWIPVIGLQHDPEYYPDPNKFDPERFSEENKHKRHPYTFIPFGEGPRVCIGLRFGMMQTKVGLAVLLKNYKFSISSKTHLPLKFDPKSFIITTEGGIWLNYTRI